ncbi:MAG: acyl-CoA dehydrogenase family protein [Halieaceae bacterium]|jgi:alkylation response protein AidB-like acyl-CoA dehydrogenase|nr:acyl-CoA dehydrogenase family protein [Halieaceae bacterium]
MEFGFSQEQQEVRQLARKILSEQVSVDTLAAFDEYAAPRFDRALWQQLLSAGLPAVAVEQRYGGMGFGFMELALFIEEIGRSIAPVPAIAHCVAATLPVQRFGSEAMKEAILPAAASGELLLTAALAEYLNEDPAEPRAVTAVADGEDLLLSGIKCGVPFAAQASHILVSARSAKGVAVVLLDPRSAGVTLHDLQVTSFEPQCDLELDSVRVPASAILSTSDGARIMGWTCERATAAICAHQLGASDFAMRLAASYTSERRQFDVPVATFQAVGHRMADCYIDIECLRLTTYQAASLLHSDVSAATEVRIAKIWAGDTGHRVSYATQHVHGGTGIDRDYPLWRYCLWLRQNEMTLGSSAAHLARLGSQLAAGEALFG